MTVAALWLDAWLRGAVGSDDLQEHLAWTAPDAPAVVAIDGAEPQGLSELLRSLQRVGQPRLWLLLPRPGRVLGWPRGVTGAPEPAVLVSGRDSGCALLRVGRAGWRWDGCDPSGLLALQGRMLTPRSGARALAELATAAARRLEQLGVDRPAGAARTSDWQQSVDRLPPAVDPQVVALLTRLAALLDALDLATREDGAAITAGEVRARSAEVRGVIGEMEDIVAGVVNGLNVPRPGTVEAVTRLR